jgi:YbbR domain-containing protein
VDITLEGSRGKLDEINARNLVARVDIGQLSPGERILRLSKENVTVELPEGVQIVRVEPGSVALKLERSVERELEVEARLEGQPAEGFEIRARQVTPSRIKVRGPESHVNALARAYTETIQIDGRRETFDKTQIAVDVPDPKVSLPEAQAVSVRVEIAETQLERRIAGVAVRSASGAPVAPQAAAVTVSGPRSIVERLRAEELSIVVEQGPDGATRARLVLPPPYEGRVTLVGTSPAELTLQK